VAQSVMGGTYATATRAVTDRPASVGRPVVR
jgi:hypothetical protein